MHQLFLSLATSALSISCFAQNSSAPQHTDSATHGYFYVRAGAGAASGYSGDIASTTTNAFTVKTYTSGVSGILGGGYMFNNHFGIDLEANIVAPGTKYSLPTYIYFDSASESVPNDLTRKVQNLVLINPGIVMQTGGTRLNLYTRLSLVLPVIDRLTSDNLFSTTTSKGTTQYAMTTDVRMSFTPGFSAACGVSYQLTPHLSMWLEGSALSLAPYDKSLTITSLTANGVNEINNYTATQKVSNYGHSGTILMSNGLFDPSPMSPASTRPMSHLGLQAGVALKLGDINPGEKNPDARKPSLYVTGGVGYSLPFANNSNGGSYTGTWHYLYSNPNTLTNITFTDKRASFTSGLVAVGGIGCMFGDHLGVELDGHTSLISVKYKYAVSSSETNGTDLGGYSGTSIAHSPVLLMPTLVLQTGGNTQQLYSKLGIVVPLNTQLTVEINGNNPTLYERNKLSTLFTLGYTASVGYKYNLNSRLQLWGEVNLLSFQPYIKEDKVVAYTINGVQQPPSKPNEYTYTTTANIATFTSPTSTLPYSSAGLRVGVSYSLAGK